MKTMRNFVMDLSGVPASFNDIRFEGGHFAGSCAVYNDCMIIGGILERGIFNDCHFINVDLDFTSATFNDCVFENCTGINYMQYATVNDCEFIRCTESDYNDGTEWYDDYKTDFEYDYEDKIAELRKSEDFQRCFEDFRAFLSERTIGSEPKEEPVVIEVEEPVVVEEVKSNSNPVIAKLQELMVQALEEGDFAKYDELEERLNRISK